MNRHLSFSLKILPPLLSIFMVFSIIQVERIFLPVTQNFEFTKMHRNIYMIEIEGIFTPLRNCQWVGGRFIGYEEQGEKKLMRIDRVNSNSTKYAGANKEDIGVWEFEYNPSAPLKQLEFVGYFKCHPFWVTENVIARFKAPKSIYDSNGSLLIDELDKDLLQEKI